MHKDLVNSTYSYSSVLPSPFDHYDSKISNLSSNPPERIKPEERQTKLFIGGLSWDTTKENMYEYFSRFGSIVDCILMTDNGTGRSRGFGFVTFHNISSVKNVFSQKTHYLDGKIIDPKIAIPKNIKNMESKAQSLVVNSGAPSIDILPRKASCSVKLNSPSTYETPAATTPRCLSRSSSKLSNCANSNATNNAGVAHSSKIFVGGIGNASESELRAYFSKFGKVIDVIIMMDKSSGRPRGFGFVGFETATSAELTASMRYHILRSKQIEVKKAFPKDLRSNGNGQYFYPDSYDLSNYNFAYSENNIEENYSALQSSVIPVNNQAALMNSINGDWDFDSIREKPLYGKENVKVSETNEKDVENNEQALKESENNLRESIADASVSQYMIEDKILMRHGSCNSDRKYKNSFFKDNEFVMGAKQVIKNSRIRNHSWCDAIGLSSDLPEDTKKNIIQLLNEIWKGN